LTKEERETQKKLRELAREERDRGKRVKIGYRKIQINGDWFRWDKIQEKLKKICLKKERIRRRLGEKMYKEKGNKKVEGQRHRKVREKRENKRIEVQ
jgi:hypothetical protein